MVTTSLNPRFLQTWELCLSSQGCWFRLSFSVWSTSLDPAVVGVQMTILHKILPHESVFATCSAVGSLFSVHAQGCVNKQKTLGWLWQSRWFEQDPVNRIPGCWWGKNFPTALSAQCFAITAWSSWHCSPSAESWILMALLWSLNTAVPPPVRIKKLLEMGEAFEVLMASGSPKTLHVTFPFLTCPLLNALGVTSR